MSIIHEGKERTASSVSPPPPLDMFGNSNTTPKRKNNCKFNRDKYFFSHCYKYKFLIGAFKAVQLY